ncbi:hypothetical protein H4582DRAFT_2052068 [Lactarius indigo]|nr:hypothetical protein H4582DRAFT_2052068 [Lactarius indigo]
MFEECWNPEDAVDPVLPGLFRLIEVMGFPILQFLCFSVNESSISDHYTASTLLAAFNLERVYTILSQASLLARASLEGMYVSGHYATQIWSRLADLAVPALITYRPDDVNTRTRLGDCPQLFFKPPLHPWTIERTLRSYLGLHRVTELIGSRNEKIERGVAQGGYACQGYSFHTASYRVSEKSLGFTWTTSTFNDSVKYHIGVKIGA